MQVGGTGLNKTLLVARAWSLSSKQEITSKNELGVFGNFERVSDWIN